MYFTSAPSSLKQQNMEENNKIIKVNSEHPKQTNAIICSGAIRSVHETFASPTGSGIFN